MLTEIDHALPRLSRAEKAVAEWVLANPRRTTLATVSDVARLTGVSQPTVIRFCRSLGARGFSDFKLQLAASVGRPGSFAHRDVNHDDSPADAVLKVLDSSLTALHALRGRAESLPFAEAVRVLGEARQIVFAGLGASGRVAEDAAQKYFRLGIPCSTATDDPTLLQMSAIATGGDVFVAISNGGQWPAMVRSMQNVRAGDALVIALTDPDSPLAANADVLFPRRVDEDASVYTPMRSRLEQLAILDALQVSLAVSLGPNAETRLRASKEALSSALSMRLYLHDKP